MSSTNDLFLRDGAKIVVIGAGPAGSFFAHFAQQMARARGIRADITIFDAKSFLKEGPPGCNMCAGVVPDVVVRDLAEVGILLPPEKVQREIEGYSFHAGGGRLLFKDVQPGGHIYAVFRGNGPRFATSHAHISFDDFLLRHVEAEGAKVVMEPVFAIELPKLQGAPVLIRYGRPPVTDQMAADLVVGAFGLNTRMVEQVERLGFGYRAPRSLRAFQAELPLGRDLILKHFGNNIHIFCLDHKNIRFGSFVPKLDFLTVSLVGRTDVGLEDFRWFMSLPEVQGSLPSGWRMPDRFCSCHPKFPISPATKPYADRLVMVGDAAWSRYYKNGIGSAFLTARLAAQTAFSKGVAKENFRDHYEQECLRRIVRDNRYGMTMFRANDFIAGSRWHMGVLARVTATPRAKAVQQALHRVYWGMFTGSASYRSLFFLSLSPAVQLPLILSGILSAGESIAAALTRLARAVFPFLASRPAPYLGPLRDGASVAIVGGGPAGAAGAIALKKFSRERGLSLDVVLYEGKVFAGEKQYNQCAGVLSPPIEELLERELGIPFPRELVQRVVKDYHLSCDRTNITLRGKDETSQALRRVLFDDYLLTQAKAHGVRIIQSRVTDLEFNRNGVMVYSESDNRLVDAVVGAFGMDDGCAAVFERATPYRRPRCLQTVVTKIHPGMDFMARFGEEVFAFLPSLIEIEFGAVIPKYNHLTIIIAGRRVTHESMNRLLGTPEVRNLLPADFSPEHYGLQYFKGRFPTHFAGRLFGDRYVTIGDASGLVRPFKGKGVTAAVSTAIKAVNTMLTRGISSEAFEAYYRQCHDVTSDIPYGRAVRWAVVLGAKLGLMSSVIKLAGSDGASQDSLRDALFACASGSKPYRQVCADAFSVGLCLRLARAILADKLVRALRGFRYPAQG
jgi:flavin-dependent dehydrogenase